jgi:hypothetical protein
MIRIKKTHSYFATNNFLLYFAYHRKKIGISINWHFVSLNLNFKPKSRKFRLFYNLAPYEEIVYLD